MLLATGKENSRGVSRGLANEDIIASFRKTRDSLILIV